LTYAFAKTMAQRGSGHIPLVASIAGFNPTPMTAAYGAAKAYVISLAEALHVELAPKVGVTVLSPGLIEPIRHIPVILYRHRATSLAYSPVISEARCGQIR
jgi:short-subunit dehydrogenase